MSKTNKKDELTETIDEAESILEYMKKEIKQWNGWSCLSISRPGAGSVLQKEIVVNSFNLSTSLPEDELKEKIDVALKDSPKWDDTLVPVQIHKELPALGVDGLYRAYTNRTVGFVKITNTEFGGLVCDRGYSFCVGDPFALDTAEFPTAEEEAEKLKKK